LEYNEATCGRESRLRTAGARGSLVLFFDDRNEKGSKMAIAEVDYIWKNGELVPWAEATTHVLSHSLHYGSGVFEGIRCYKDPDSDKSYVFRLRDHMERLHRSCKIALIDLPYTVDELCEATLEVIRANNLPACYIRPLVYRGYGVMGVDPTGCAVDVIIAVWPWGSYLGGDALEKNAKGVVGPVKRVCRLLIGMHRPQAELIRFRMECNPLGVFSPIDDELYEKQMLSSFDYTGLELDEVLARTRTSQPVIRSGEWGEERMLIGPEQTPYFGCTMHTVDGSIQLKPTGEIRIGIVTDGEGEVLFPGGNQHVQRGSELFFPHDAQEITLQGSLTMVMCHPAGAKMQ